MSAVLARLRVDVAPVLALAALEREEAMLVPAAPDVAAAVQALQESQRPDVAVKLLAYALPPPEAVWWASMCAEYTEGDAATPDEIASRTAAEQWVWDRTESARRACDAAARRAGFRSPHGWVGMAAFWSGGSIAPVHLPAVPPAPHLCGRAVVGAVSLAAVRASPDRRAARLRRFIASAHDIADGEAGRLGHEAA